MSEFGRNELGEDWTAFEVKDLFNTTGKKFEWFVCSFCDVPIHAVACYGNEYVTAPHYAYSDSEHIAPCPYAGNAKSIGGARKTASTIEGVPIELPERFVPIRVPSGRLEFFERPVKPASTNDITARIARLYGVASRVNTYSTSLLETLIAARKYAVKKLYAIAEEKISKKEEWAKFVFGSLQTFPLQLYGQKTNYRDAFRSTKIPPSTQSAIYTGLGTVLQTTTGFTITSIDMPRTKLQGPAPEVQAKAIIVVNLDIRNPISSMQSRTADALLKASFSQARIEWAAYGIFKKPDGIADYQVEVSEPGHVCVL